MRLQSSSLQRFLAAWPGKQRFGIYRTLPLFFLIGAALEFSMINWKVGEINFYKVFKEKQANKKAWENLAVKQEVTSETK